LPILAPPAPRPRPPVWDPRDVRTGYRVVAEAGVTAVLDWYFAAWGEPHADLGWFGAKCRRFGRA